MLTGPLRPSNLTFCGQITVVPAGDTNPRSKPQPRALVRSPHILISVGVGVNPDFSTKKVRLCKPVPCPRVQGVVHWWGFIRRLLRLGYKELTLAAQAILLFENRLGFPQKLMPRNRQSEDSILRNISDRFPSSSWKTGRSIAL